VTDELGECPGCGSQEPMSASACAKCGIEFETPIRARSRVWRVVRRVGAAVLGFFSGSKEEEEKHDDDASSLLDLTDTHVNKDALIALAIVKLARQTERNASALWAIAVAVWLVVGVAAVVGLSILRGMGMRFP